MRVDLLSTIFHDFIIDFSQDAVGFFNVTDATSGAAVGVKIDGEGIRHAQMEAKRFFARHWMGIDQGMNDVATRIADHPKTIPFCSSFRAERCSEIVERNERSISFFWDTVHVVKRIGKWRLL